MNDQYAYFIILFIFLLTPYYSGISAYIILCAYRLKLLTIESKHNKY